MSWNISNRGEVKLIIERESQAVILEVHTLLFGFIVWEVILPSLVGMISATVLILIGRDTRG